MTCPAGQGGVMQPWPALAILAVLLSACSSSSSEPAPPAAAANAKGTSCGTVDVPAHEGVDVLAYGIDCPAARDIVRVAEGRGRAAYDTGGYACTPSPAPDGDTFYDCVASGGKRITFRYGVV